MVLYGLICGIMWDVFMVTSKTEKIQYITILKLV